MNVMIKAAEKAGRVLVRDFGEVENLQVSAKGPGDFVSAADRRAEEIIKDELSYARPDIGFLMEESGAHQGKDPDQRWIVDPLDGTTNFLHGLPHWAISIALEVRGEIVAGLVYDPIKDEMFRAEKGQGAFLRRQRLRVSGRRDPLQALVACGCARRSKTFMAEFGAISGAGMAVRRFGAAALDLCYVAAGRYEAYWERNLNAWDIAAGLLIVREAGGFTCDLDKGSANPVDTGNLLAGNEPIFNEVKKVLKAVS